MGQDSLLAAFRRQLEARPSVRRWLIGFSGGLDSRVLAELAARSLDRDSVVLLHVNHQLQAAADDWAQHCLQTAGQLGLAIRILRVSPASASEADARDARYAAFERELGPGDCLLLGHHADDQAETVLLRLLRGSGVQGLRGIPRQRRLGAATLLRPLLDHSRAELEGWARERGLVDWVEDPSNATEHYDRNYLRLRVMPALFSRWPDTAQRLGQSASHLNDADELLRELAREDLERAGAGQDALSLSRLRALSPARRNNLLRYWCSDLAGVAPNAKQLATLQREFFEAAGDRQPAMPIGDRNLRRYRDSLYLVACATPASAAELAALPVVPGDTECAQGCLRIRRGDGGLMSLEGLSLRYRRDGERCRPAGRSGSHPLKKLFQEHGVPPWLRDGWPLLVRGDEIVAVPGLFVCEGWQSAPGENGFVLEWQP